jgi:hypothetical protein
MVRADDFQPPEIAVDVKFATRIYSKCSADTLTYIASSLASGIRSTASSRYKFLRWRVGATAPAHLTLTILDKSLDVVMLFSVGGEKDLERPLFGSSAATIRAAATTCNKDSILTELTGKINAVLNENDGANFVTDLLRYVPLAKPVKLLSSRSVLVAVYEDCIAAGDGSLLELYGRARTNEKLVWTLTPNDVWIDTECYACIETTGQVGLRKSARDPVESDWESLRNRNSSADAVFMSSYVKADGPRQGTRALPKKVKCEE